MEGTLPGVITLRLPAAAFRADAFSVMHSGPIMLPDGRTIPEGTEWRSAVFEVACIGLRSFQACTHEVDKDADGGATRALVTCAPPVSCVGGVHVATPAMVPFTVDGGRDLALSVRRSTVDVRLRRVILQLYHPGYDDDVAQAGSE